MEWEDTIKFLVTSGVLTTIVGTLAKCVLKWIGDHLGWGEIKKQRTADLLIGAAERAIRAAEQSAKHKKFAYAEDQSLWKESYAADMVMKLTGTDKDLAKAALRAVFNVSDLNHKPKTSHEDVHRFEDADVDRIVQRLLGDKK